VLCLSAEIDRDCLCLWSVVRKRGKMDGPRGRRRVDTQERKERTKCPPSRPQACRLATQRRDFSELHLLPLSGYLSFFAHVLSSLPPSCLQSFLLNSRGSNEFTHFRSKRLFFNQSPASPSIHPCINVSIQSPSATSLTESNCSVVSLSLSHAHTLTHTHAHTHTHTHTHFWGAADVCGSGVYERVHVCACVVCVGSSSRFSSVCRFFLHWQADRGIS